MHDSDNLLSLNKKFIFINKDKHYLNRFDLNKFKYNVSYMSADVFFRKNYFKSIGAVNFNNLQSFNFPEYNLNTLRNYNDFLFFDFKKFFYDKNYTFLYNFYHKDLTLS